MRPSADGAPASVVEREVHHQVLVLRQNRPEVLNARNEQMYCELIAGLRWASADDSIAAVVLAGSGRFFCAGMDLNRGSRGREVRNDDAADVRAVKLGLPPHDPEDPRTSVAMRLVDEVIGFDKPLIAAVNGPAVGEGFTSLLHCDVVYAAAGSWFWAPFGRAGVVPEFASTMLLPWRLGSLGGAALFLARRISDEEALRVGFVAEILSAGDGFQAAVLSRVLEGLELMGPPHLRTPTLQTFKRLVRGPWSADELRAQALEEFVAIRERERRDEPRQVRAHYGSQLPVRRR